jgi:hypothetical protein
MHTVACISEGKCGLNECGVGECLRKVSEMRTRARLHLLGVEAEGVGQLEQSLK